MEPSLAHFAAGIHPDFGQIFGQIFGLGESAACVTIVAT